MATKSKLEQAVERKASELNEAQREIVLSQLSVYRRNAQRLSDVESELSAVSSRHASTRDEVRVKQATRAALSHEINQLSTANSQIAADLSAMLKE